MRKALTARHNTARLNSRRNHDREFDRTGKAIQRFKQETTLHARGWSDDDQEYERELYAY
jgi:hypothetical protein